jgi:ANTAR domain
VRILSGHGGACQRDRRSSARDRAGTLSLNAQVLAQTQRLIARLQSALEARAVIGQAIGILMSRSGGTEDDARVWLRSLSQARITSWWSSLARSSMTPSAGDHPHRSG